LAKMSEPPEKSEDNKKAAAAQNTSSNDSVEISAEAQSMLKLQELTEAAKSSTDIRPEKVAEMKAKIKSGEIPSSETGSDCCRIFSEIFLPGNQPVISYLKS